MTSLFAPLEKEHRIFQRRDGPSPPLKTSARRPAERPLDIRQGAVRPGKGQQNGRTDWPRTFALANNRVLERFASPFVVVTEDGTVMHYSSHVGGVLQPALGPPSRSVFDMARRGLRHPLRAALRSAAESGRTVEHAVAGDADGVGALTLVVEPLPGQEPDRPYLIVFQDNGPSPVGG